MAIIRVCRDQTFERTIAEIGLVRLNNDNLNSRQFGLVFNVQCGVDLRHRCKQHIIRGIHWRQLIQDFNEGVH